MKLDNPKVVYRESDDTWILKGYGTKLVLVDKCLECGKPFLAEPKQIKLGIGKYCSFKCAKTGINHPMWGKHHTKEHRKNISNSLSGEKHPNYGKFNEDHPSWKGGVKEKNIPLHDTYAHQINYAEEVRETEEGYLEVRCATCTKWFMPTRNAVRSRIKALNGKMRGESRLYCSEPCKKSCSIYYQKKYPKGHKPDYSREVQPELRELVLERDDYTCIRCGSKERPECHHLDGILYEPLLSADMDECITVCHECHKEIHKEKGCTLQDMKCAEQK